MLWTIFALLVDLGRPPMLGLPVRCEIGRTCWIQKYADVGAGPARLDYRCGAITTDEHDGIDFRLASLAQMRAGVNVLAAATGTVARVRDGEPDLPVAVRGGTGGKDAGNGVVIAHANGWETQYSHLRSGSILVRPGQHIDAGAPIGLIGLSGNTEYPHLHFAVRRGSEKIDPFTGRALPGPCNAAGARSMWSPRASGVLSYASGQLVRLAFANAPQDRSHLEAADPSPPTRTEPLVLIGELIAPLADDVLSFQLFGPGGEMLAERQVRVDRTMLSWVSYIGKKPPLGGWKPGRYTGKFVALRGGHEAARSQVSIDLR